MFHSLPREYPAPATALFLAPLALPFSYALGFALLAAAGAVALVLSSDGLAEYPGWSRRTCIYLLVGSAAVVFARYDVFPALAALLAVEAARREQWGRAWAWAVVGGLLKLFPFLLLPGFLIAERVQTGKWPLQETVDCRCTGRFVDARSAGHGARGACSTPLVISSIEVSSCRACRAASPSF